jgi:hypothetical protein
MARPQLSRGRNGVILIPQGVNEYIWTLPCASDEMINTKKFDPNRPSGRCGKCSLRRLNCSRLRIRLCRLQEVARRGLRNA